MLSLKRLFLVCLIFGVLGAPISAESSPVTIDASEYRDRRRALVEALRAELSPGEMGILILPSVPERETLTYRQESNLYYLTGTEIPRSTLVLLFDRTKKKRTKKKGATSGHYVEYLYLPEKNVRRERWTGSRPSAGG